jgi:hypothetical protein
VRALSRAGVPIALKISTVSIECIVNKSLTDGDGGVLRIDEQYD